MTADRVAQAAPGKPVLHLRLQASLPSEALPSRAEARDALGLPQGALIVTAPDLAASAKSLRAVLRVLPHLRARFPSLRLVVTGATQAFSPLVERTDLAEIVTVTGRVLREDFVRHLVAADVVLALRFPSFGEMSAAIVQAMRIGRPVLVTAGTPPAVEMPEGTVVPVDAGSHEEAELTALLSKLLSDAAFREEIGQLARAHVEEEHDAGKTSRELVHFLTEVDTRRSELLGTVARRNVSGDTLLDDFKDEVRRSARELGLAGTALALDEWFGDLARERR
jgi:hypothetical protein